MTKVEEEERERKKKKNEKKVEVRAQKAKEQNEKQATWKKFAKKSEKKGIHIAGVAGTSIFKTPDNPMGKGVFRSVLIVPM
jgi:survival-of-motor-neuron-related-splicing factor 30